MVIGVSVSSFLSYGQIIFLSTDGIWETRNKKGEMLGKEPILNAIRQNASSDATQIIDAIFDILDKFIGEVKIEDDITSVIIKMQDWPSKLEKSDKLIKNYSNIISI